jgi:single-strand DNA-binding protein
MQMNSFSFTGNIGRDAEIRDTSSSSITSFPVAVKAGYGDNAVTTWVNCNMWGDRGEAVAEYLTKGALVGITGELQLRKYTNRDGEEKQNLEVRVVDLTLLGGKRRDDEQPTRDARQPAKSKPQSNGQKAPAGFDDFEDDIPF